MTQSAYARRWHDLKRRRLLNWALFLGYLPGVALIVVAMDRSAPGWHGADIYVVLSWMTAFLASAVYQSAFRCPRCGQRFFSTAGWHNPWARKCLHCGLPRGGGPDAP